MRDGPCLTSEALLCGISVWCAARVLGWGGGYNNESIVEFLAHVQRAHVVSYSVFVNGIP